MMILLLYIYLIINQILLLLLLILQHKFQILLLLLLYNTAEIPVYWYVHIYQVPGNNNNNSISTVCSYIRYPLCLSSAAGYTISIMFMEYQSSDWQNFSTLSLLMLLVYVFIRFCILLLLFIVIIFIIRFVLLDYCYNILIITRLFIITCLRFYQI